MRLCQAVICAAISVVRELTHWLPLLSSNGSLDYGGVLAMIDLRFGPVAALVRILSLAAITLADLNPEERPEP